MTSDIIKHRDHFIATIKVVVRFILSISQRTLKSGLLKSSKVCTG